jgi:hypothetical protein
MKSIGFFLTFHPSSSLNKPRSIVVDGPVMNKTYLTLMASTEAVLIKTSFFIQGKMKGWKRSSRGRERIQLKKSLVGKCEESKEDSEEEETDEEEDSPLFSSFSI